MNDLRNLVGLTKENAVSFLEKMGYRVEIVKCSKPKIKTDCELVLVARERSSNVIELVIGDFLVDV